MKFDLSPQMSELIGAIIGDGCIRYKPKYNQYYIEIVGDKEKELEYFNYLSNIFKTELNLNAKIKIRERGLRLKVYSKEFLEFLINDLMLPPNKEKGKNVFIPDKIMQNDKILPYCIRGICDTDGSLFFANKGYRKDYPTIEITTTSRKLAKQLNNALSKKLRIGFRSHKRERFLRLFIISINGEEMVDKYIKEIGFSNSRNIEKYKKSGTAGI